MAKTRERGHHRNAKGRYSKSHGRRPVKRKRSVKRNRRAQPRATSSRGGKRRTSASVKHRHHGAWFGETSLIPMEEQQRQREEDKILKAQMQVLLNSPEYMAKAAEKWGTSMAEARVLVENIRDGNIR